MGRTGAAAYTKKAEELKAVSLASAMEMVEKLEVKLADFAKRHKHDIQHDPAFRSKFFEMCAPLGGHCILTLFLLVTYVLDSFSTINPLLRCGSSFCGERVLGKYVGNRRVLL